MPRQPRHGNLLLLHGEFQANVVKQDRAPADKDARRGEIHEPVKHRQGIVVQGQEAEEHECGEKRDADVGRAPRGRPEEDPGGLALECQAVQDPRARQQRLVARAPGASDDDGVDQAGDCLDAGGAGSDDERTLRGGAALVAEAWVVAGHQHAHDEDGEHVEKQDPGKDLLACSGDGATGILGLGGGHGDGLDASEGKDGAGHDAPEAEEFPPVSRGDVLNKRPGVLPVFETDAFCPWDAAQVDDEAEDDQEYDQQDFEDGKDIFNLSKDLLMVSMGGQDGKGGE